MTHLMPEDVLEEDFTTITDVNDAFELFSDGKISLAELDRLKDSYYKWYYSPQRYTTVLRFYRQPDGTMTIYEQVYVQTYDESGNPAPTGTCYRDAWRYVMHHVEGVLVHGTAVSLSTMPPGGRVNHAWVELPDGTIWEPASQTIFPIEKFYSLVDPIVEDRYTADEAAHMLGVGKHGPWSAEDRMKYIGR